MKNEIFNLGRPLNKKELKSINGSTGDCDLPEPVNGTQTHLCPGCAVVINPITCIYWCECL